MKVKKEKKKNTQSVKKKKKIKMKRIEELWSSKESTPMCLLSYVIPSFFTIIEMV